MKLLIMAGLSIFLACSSAPSEKPEKNSVATDTSRIFYSGSGQLKMKGRMVNGKKEGEWRSWYEDGTPWSLTTFEKGIRNGKTITWYENGQLRYEGSYRDDKRSGHWIFFEENGTKASEMNYPE